MQDEGNLLREIIKNQEEVRKIQKQDAKIFLNHASEVSDFMNSQNKLNLEFSLANSKFTTYLEGNKATNQKGAIESLNDVMTSVQDLKKDLNKIEHKLDRKIAYFTGAGLVLMYIIKWIFAKLSIAI